ncbi:hypothetical protein DITRI_Ditri07aG0048900 [Diplodiscus trichospermus]
MEGSSIRTLEKICVFYGANYGKDENYVKAAHRLGEAVAVHGRQVLGIVLLAFIEKNLIGKTCGKELKVATMHKQLLKMMEFGDAFIALPGDFGTLEELFQIVSWAQLNIHKKTYRCAKC